MSNIEEDVNELKSIMNLRTESGFAYSQKNILKLQKSIRNVLAEIEQKDKRIKELEEEKNKTQIMSHYYVKENYILKQLVRDKIEELKNQISIDICIENNLEKHYELKYKIDVLQELLEGEK